MSSSYPEVESRSSSRQYRRRSTSRNQHRSQRQDNIAGDDNDWPTGTPNNSESLDRRKRRREEGYEKGRDAHARRRDDSAGNEEELEYERKRRRRRDDNDEERDRSRTSRSRRGAHGGKEREHDRDNRRSHRSSDHRAGHHSRRDDDSDEDDHYSSRRRRDGKEGEEKSRDDESRSRHHNHRRSRHYRRDSPSRSPSRSLDRDASHRALDLERTHRQPNPSKASLPTTRSSPSRTNPKEQKQEQDPIEKKKPNYKPTGVLAAETLTVQRGGQSIVLKYSEPAEARKPPGSQHWVMFVFKGNQVVDKIELSTRSCWLFGREKLVADVLTENGSCSKQHAVLQFRFVEGKNGGKAKVKPYILDLESVNGTFLNSEKMPERRYVEVRDKDVITFGESEREYTIILDPGN